MLTPLPNKQIAEQWDLFKDVLRSSVPMTRDMLPSWLTDCLYLALCGRIQCWVAIDERAPTREERDRAYAAFITKPVVDEMTGQQALLIYAFKVYHLANKATRKQDVYALGKWAKAQGYQRLTAYCHSKVVANLLKKAFPEAQEVTFASVELQEVGDGR